MVTEVIKSCDNCAYECQNICRVKKQEVRSDYVCEKWDVKLSLDFDGDPDNILRFIDR